MVNGLAHRWRHRLTQHLPPKDFRGDLLRKNARFLTRPVRHNRRGNPQRVFARERLLHSLLLKTQRLTRLAFPAKQGLRPFVRNVLPLGYQGVQGLGARGPPI